MYIQYGCGFCAPQGWLNFDASPTLRWERLPLLGRLYTKNEKRFPANVAYGDIMKGLPVEPESCRGVYASHVLEHLSLAEARAALRRTHGYLRPQGIFRVVVPDMALLIEEYQTALGAGDREAMHHLMERAQLGREAAPVGLLRKLMLVLGHSAHQWMWDYDSLAAELEQAGFAAIRRCAFGDCEDQRFREVEDRGRFQDALAVECRKLAANEDA